LKIISTQQLESSPSVCLLPRFTPPHTRQTASLPVASGNSKVSVTLYESVTPFDEEGAAIPDDVILAQVSLGEECDNDRETF